MGFQKELLEREGMENKNVPYSRIVTSTDKGHAPASRPAETERVFGLFEASRLGSFLLHKIK